ncbi:hypothetical protein [Streptomyces sp. SCSIO ZS0520]|uniref:hypothetical protein n=1 Tax=Streptomyces sp. SCSIO ZS0520 TaxID=2892996 RepID=UPI0021D977CF|nr:hypothetical protein [Streptomyces sp. SCSIO ZS0520]
MSGMPISDKDPVNGRELARILGISAVAAMRGGELTTAQKKRIDRIVKRAKDREDRKRSNKN